MKERAMGVLLGERERGEKIKKGREMRERMRKMMFRKEKFVNKDADDQC